LVGSLWSKIYSYTFSSQVNTILSAKLYTAWISKEFKNFGKNSVIYKPINLKGGNYISIGNKTSIGTRASLTAWDKYRSQTFQPTIIIGNNVSVGDDSHITAINRIEIGDNVLTGKKITITDNSHGKSNFDLLMFSPLNRPLYSVGPVYIEDGVWIGDKVTILPNVRIGKNAIIGANAVVTKDIPANCVAGGIPAKVLKIMK
jgi:acetyltransferase-like isoleucine patch superfamily enzyme